jgi:hypothetical protein
MTDENFEEKPMTEPDDDIRSEHDGLGDRAARVFGFDARVLYGLLAPAALIVVFVVAFIVAPSGWLLAVLILLMVVLLGVILVGLYNLLSEDE